MRCGIRHSRESRTTVNNRNNMSLSLLQGYSSAEENEEEAAAGAENGDSPLYVSDGDGQISATAKRYDPSVFDFTNPAQNSVLPSAFDVFSQISGPPEFLNNLVEEDASARDLDDRSKRRGGKRDRMDKKDSPSAVTGVVVEAKAQLVGIHERVRSDIEGSKPASTVSNTTENGVKRVPSATNPTAEDAADLLRMCLQCGIPKTYSNTKGLVCPQCSDRPPVQDDQESKKKGSIIKDKEKSKRMKGQSSHATWKSETEMHLRQQFD